MGQTVEQAVDRHFEPAKRAGVFFDNSGDGRIFGHDFIHTMLNTELGTARSEEIAAIYQAVLLNDPTFTTSTEKPWVDAGTPVTPEDIQARIMPGVDKFVCSITARMGKGRRYRLSPEEIIAHYENAVVLRERFHQQFGRTLGEIPIAELRTMEFEPFRSLVFEIEARQPQGMTAAREVIQGPPCVVRS